MNELHKRMKILRKEMKMSQEAFGKILGVTGPAISKIESGDRNPSEAIIKSSCREFHINETWLRTGEGPMEAPMATATDQLMGLIDTMNVAELEKMVGFLDLIIQIKGESAAPDDRAALHQALDAELDAQKDGQMSEAFTDGNLKEKSS